MTRRPQLDEAAIERAVSRVGRSQLDRRDLKTPAADLSPAAIAARRDAQTKTGRDGGMTGREMIEAAGRHLHAANKAAKVASGRRGRSARTKQKQAEEMLLTAAAQIRIASVCPLDRGYLHALDIERIQTAQAEVQKAAADDLAALAVDTHRRIEDQRARIRAEGATPR